MDDIEQLRQRQHALADAQQNQILKLALQERDVTALKSEVTRLEETKVSHEELTGALGPIRGKMDLHEQAQMTLKEGLSKTATSDQLKAVIDAVNATQETLTWIGRAVIGGIVTGVLGLVWYLAQRGIAQ